MEETKPWHRLPAQGVNPSRETFQAPHKPLSDVSQVCLSALGKRHRLNDLSRSLQTRFSVMLRDRIPGLMDLWPDPQ